MTKVMEASRDAKLSIKTPIHVRNDLMKESLNVILTSTCNISDVHVVHNSETLNLNVSPGVSLSVSNKNASNNSLNVMTSKITKEVSVMNHTLPSTSITNMQSNFSLNHPTSSNTTFNSSKHLEIVPSLQPMMKHANNTGTRRKQVFPTEIPQPVALPKIPRHYIPIENKSSGEILSTETDNIQLTMMDASNNLSGLHTSVSNDLFNFGELNLLNRETSNLLLPNGNNLLRFRTSHQEISNTHPPSMLYAPLMNSTENWQFSRHITSASLGSLNTSSQSLTFSVAEMNLVKPFAPNVPYLVSPVAKCLQSQSDLPIVLPRTVYSVPCQLNDPPMKAIQVAGLKHPVPVYEIKSEDEEDGIEYKVVEKPTELQTEMSALKCPTPVKKTKSVNVQRAQNQTEPKTKMSVLNWQNSTKSKSGQAAENPANSHTKMSVVNWHIPKQSRSAEVDVNVALPQPEKPALQWRIVKKPNGESGQLTKTPAELKTAMPVFKFSTPVQESESVWQLAENPEIPQTEMPVLNINTMNVLKHLKGMLPQEWELCNVNVDDYLVSEVCASLRQEPSDVNKESVKERLLKIVEKYTLHKSIKHTLNILQDEVCLENNLANTKAYGQSNYQVAHDNTDKPVKQTEVERKIKEHKYNHIHDSSLLVAMHKLFPKPYIVRNITKKRLTSMCNLMGLQIHRKYMFILYDKVRRLAILHGVKKSEEQMMIELQDKDGDYKVPLLDVRLLVKCLEANNLKAEDLLDERWSLFKFCGLLNIRSRNSNLRRIKKTLKHIINNKINSSNVGKKIQVGKFNNITGNDSLCDKLHLKPVVILKRIDKDISIKDVFCKQPDRLKTLQYYKKMNSFCVQRNTVNVIQFTTKNVTRWTKSVYQDFRKIVMKKTPAKTVFRLRYSVLESGTVVFVRDFANRNLKWLKGVVVKQIASFQYLIDLDCGIQWNCYVQQIRPIQMFKMPFSSVKIESKTVRLIKPRSVLDL